MGGCAGGVDEEDEEDDIVDDLEERRERVRVDFRESRMGSVCSDLDVEGMVMERCVDERGMRFRVEREGRRLSFLE